MKEMKKTMKEMKKIIMKYAWCVWLGGGITIMSGYYITDWQWYAFVVPLVVLILLSKNTDEK